MSMPVKALLYGQLRKTGEPLPPSGHEVSKVVFTGADGTTEITGFYKPIDNETYPELLAKCSSAISLLFRMAFGDIIALDIPVFKKTVADNGSEAFEICGTVSVAIPKFKPLLCSGKTLPEDPQERELVYPSVATIMSRGGVKALVASHLSKDDDPHPGNIGTGEVDGETVFVLIDHDLRYADEWAEALKTLRLVDGVLKDVPAVGLPIKGSDIDNFPDVPGKTFWPSYEVPGNINFSKRCMAYLNFKALAANPVLETEKGKTSFQNLSFHSMLQFLMTWDPDTYRARLQEYFADTPLDFLSLPEASRKVLTARSRERYNTETDRKPFVDYMVKLAQDNYDEAYRAIVFYMGCETNLSGKKVMGFHQYLHNNPSAYRDICAWTEKENLKHTGHWNDPACFYQPEKLKNRYHQIWRDSRVLIIQECLFLSDKLARDLENKLQISPSLAEVKPDLISPEDPELTDAWRLLDTGSTTRQVQTDCAPVNSLGLAMRALDEMTARLRQASNHYYKLPLERLTIEENKIYRDHVHEILEEYKTKILDYLEVPPWTKAFMNILEMLNKYYSNLDFPVHLWAEDAPIESENAHFYPNLLRREHTDKDIVDTALKALFNWVNKLDKDIFEHHIAEVFNQYKAVKRLKRIEEIENYLKSSPEDNANKLAYILATPGRGMTTTSLNTQLIKILIPQVLDDAIGQVDCNLRSLEQAHQRRNFRVDIYTKYAVEYARNNEEFTHFYSANSAARLNDVMYRWVQNMSYDSFKALINEAKKAYNPYFFNILSTKTRGEVIDTLFNENSCSLIKDAKMADLAGIKRPAFILNKGAFYYYFPGTKPVIVTKNEVTLSKLRTCFASVSKINELSDELLTKIKDLTGYEFNKPHSNQKILATIFSEGGIEPTSLKTHLFKILLNNMQKTISERRLIDMDPDFPLVLKIKKDKKEHMAFCLGSLEGHAKKYTWSDIVAPSGTTAMQSQISSCSI